jgi:hypothetical protein
MRTALVSVAIVVLGMGGLLGVWYGLDLKDRDVDPAVWKISLAVCALSALAACALTVAWLRDEQVKQRNRGE